MDFVSEMVLYGDLFAIYRTRSVGEDFYSVFHDKKTGSGIGLSLSRQIMQAHGGQLRAESVAGAGSTFTLVFA
jgi:signal transduction histidine kinase